MKKYTLCFLFLIVLTSCASSDSDYQEVSAYPNGLLLSAINYRIFIKQKTPNVHLEFFYKLF